MLEESFNLVTINPVSEKVSILTCYEQTHCFAFTCLLPLPFESYDAQLSNYPYSLNKTLHKTITVLIKEANRI